MRRPTTCATACTPRSTRAARTSGRSCVDKSPLPRPSRFAHLPQLHCYVQLRIWPRKERAHMHIRLPVFRSRVLRVGILFAVVAALVGGIATPSYAVAV